MNEGTVGTRILERSIIKHISREGHFGAGLGNDFSVIGYSEKDSSDKEYVTTAQGFADKGYHPGESKGLSSGELALVRAINNLATSGAEPSDIMIDIIMEKECPEQSIRDEMNILTDVAREKGFRIIGGNTVISGEGDGYSVTITAYGLLSKSKLDRLKADPQDGDAIIVIGDAGHFGASELCIEKPDGLRDRFSESYIRDALIDTDKLEIQKNAKFLLDAGVYYIHDVTFGGIYRALMETGVHLGMGIDVTHENIPIKQSTIEIGEFYNVNPYELTGTGALVAVCRSEDSERIAEELKADGIIFGVAGRLTKDKKRVVRSEDFRMERSLTYYNS